MLTTCIYIQQQQVNLVVDNSKIKWRFCVNGTLKGYYYQTNIISVLVNWYLNISWKFLIFPSTTKFHVLSSIVQNKLESGGA